MADKLIFYETLPFPPSFNHIWKTAVRGKKAVVYLSEEGRIFRSEICAIVAVKKLRLMSSARLRVTVMVHGRDRRKFDIVNREKALSDALCHAGVFVDDEQIDDFHIRRGEIVPGGKCVVEIFEIGGE